MFFSFIWVQIDKKTQISNEIILGLRKTEGISLKHFEEKFNVRIEDIYDIKKLIYNHMLEEENGYLRINEKYLYTYPINKSDIDLYPGLVIQNPGYEE